MQQSTMAVLGGGNGAHMMAAHMALDGHKVNMIQHPRFEASFRTVLERQSIQVSGIGPRGVSKLNLATTDFARGLRDARWVHVVMSAPGHEAFFEQMLPHLQEGQNVVIWAGNFSAARLYRLLREGKVTKRITVFETNTIPYGTRLREPGHIELLLWAARVRIAAMPAKDNSAAGDELKSFFPQIEVAQNVIATAFDNPNPTVHPAAALLNVGRIEYSRGDFYLYREGLTEAVATFSEFPRNFSHLVFCFLRSAKVTPMNNTVAPFHVGHNKPFGFFLRGAQLLGYVVPEVSDTD